MITLDKISKTFLVKEKNKERIKIALSDVSFHIDKGDTVGLIGANGAGKSTLIKMIAALYKPDSGYIQIESIDVTSHPDETKKKIGVLFGGDAGLYNRLTAFENIQYFGRLNGMKDTDIDERIQFFEQFFNMNEYMNRRVDGFSRGMKQKVCFLRSVIHNPEIVILDEPSTGLDVEGIQQVADFIKFNQNQNKTIIISSHNMNEIYELCNKVIVLKEGKLSYFGNLRDVVDEPGNFTKLFQYMGVKS